MTHHSNSNVRDHMKWAGLLGCEAVLSSMALMQANSMPGQKKMMSSLGQGQRDGPESHQSHPQHGSHGHQGHHSHQPHHSHMSHPPAGSCPPLLIRKDGDYHSSRLMDQKDIQANQNMQPKKKHKKSGIPINKIKEKVEPMIPHPQMDMDDDNSLKVQKNFICDHCYVAFRSSYHLKRHILTHTGEKPFACDACDMRFIQRYHLDRHKRVHSGEKPYQCDRCHQNFSRTDRLLRHRRLCTVGMTKEENQNQQSCCDNSRASGGGYSQDPPGSHTASWSPLQPANNRLTV